MKEEHFPGNILKSKKCHECREDPERMKVAMESDCKKRTVVQELICEGCAKRLSWWWFAKLPLTSEEKRAAQKRGGKVW